MGENNSRSHQILDFPMQLTRLDQSLFNFSFLLFLYASNLHSTWSMLPNILKWCQTKYLSYKSIQIKQTWTLQINREIKYNVCRWYRSLWWDFYLKLEQTRSHLRLFRTHPKYIEFVLISFNDFTKKATQHIFTYESNTHQHRT